MSKCRVPGVYMTHRLLYDVLFFRLFGCPPNKSYREAYS